MSLPWFVMFHRLLTKRWRWLQSWEFRGGMNFFTSVNEKILPSALLPTLLRRHHLDDDLQFRKVEQWSNSGIGSKKDPDPVEFFLKDRSNKQKQFLIHQKLPITFSDSVFIPTISPWLCFIPPAHFIQTPAITILHLSPYPSHFIHTKRLTAFAAFTTFHIMSSMMHP